MTRKTLNAYKNSADALRTDFPMVDTTYTKEAYANQT